MLLSLKESQIHTTLHRHVKLQLEHYNVILNVNKNGLPLKGKHQTVSLETFLSLVDKATFSTQ